MADYAFRSYHERQEIERMVEAGMSVKEIAGSLGISLSAVYAELRTAPGSLTSACATTPTWPSSVSSRGLNGEVGAPAMRHETPHLLKTKEDKTVSNNPIVLKSNRLSDECIGTVRLTPEAEKVVRRLRAKTSLPIRQIVSEIIVQAENLIDIEGPDDDAED